MRYNMSKLVERESQEKYQQELTTRVQSANKATYKWEDLQNDINQTAEIVLGHIISKNSNSIQNYEIEQLSTLQNERG